MIITNLLASMLISMGVATSATPFNLETKPKEVRMDNTSSFSYGPDRTSINSANTTYYQNNSPLLQLYRQYTRVERWNGYNEALHIKASLYQETTNKADDDTYSYFGTSGPTQFDHVIVEPNKNQMTNALWAIQIDPYRYLTDATTTITMYLTTTFYIEMDTQDPQYEWIPYNGPIYIQFDTFTSIDNHWIDYIDSATYNTKCFNNEVIADLTSGENAYTYNHLTETWQTNINANGTYHYYEINKPIDIEVVGDRANYIYILMTPYIPTQTDEINRKITCSQDPWNQQWCSTREYMNGNNTTHSITASGYMITPIETYEVVNIPGLCFEILTMPFSFVSQAFNLTLFPGTPYQINISSIFLAILGVLVFIFVLNIFIKRGG